MAVKKTRLASLLEKEDKGLSEARDILSYLHRTVLVDLDIGLNSYERLVNKYQQQCNDPKFDKGNFVKSVVNDEMTMNSLLQALEVIGVSDMKLTIELTRKNKEPTVHSIEVNNISSFTQRRRTDTKDHY